MQKFKQQQLFDRVLDKLPDHVTLLMVILSGFLLARLTWTLFPADPSLTATLDENSSEQVDVIPASARAADYGKEIATYHLLGVYQPPQAAPVAVVEAPAPAPVAPPPPKPRDSLNLVGVYALPGKEGIAIIDASGIQYVVGVGEEIGKPRADDANQKPADKQFATLVKVYDTKIDISWDGGQTSEELSMPRLEASAAGAIIVEQEFIPEPEIMVQPEIQPEVMAQPDAAVAVDPAFLEKKAARLADEESDEPSLQQLDNGLPSQDGNAVPAPPPPNQEESNAGGAGGLASFREQVAANNLKLLDAIRPSPVSKQGQLTGFRITPGRNAALFQQTGLRPGDIVTAINGTPLNSNASSMQAMQGLMTSSSAELTVSRAGQVTTVQVNF